MTMTEIFLRLAPVIVAATAGVIAWREYHHKRAEDKKLAEEKEEMKWLELTKWAIDKTNSENAMENATGWHFLVVAMDNLHKSERERIFSRAVLQYARKLDPKNKYIIRENGGGK